jgi:hypothetical protein
MDPCHWAYNWSWHPPQMAGSVNSVELKAAEVFLASVGVVSTEASPHASESSTVISKPANERTSLYPSFKSIPYEMA